MLFKTNSFWWLIALPIFLLFLFILERVQRFYTMPALLEAHEILSRISNRKKRTIYYAIMIVAIIAYFVLFLYSVAFIVQLVLVADFSLLGFAIFVFYILLSVLINRFLMSEKEKQDRE